MKTLNTGNGQKEKKMYKYEIIFGYHDLVEVELEHRDPGTALELATVKKINENNMHGLITEEEHENEMKENGIDLLNYDDRDEYDEKNNLHYMDLSTYDLIDKSKWIYYVNMDWITIREVE